MSTPYSSESPSSNTRHESSISHWSWAASEDEYPAWLWHNFGATSSDISLETTPSIASTCFGSLFLLHDTSSASAVPLNLSIRLPKILSGSESKVINYPYQHNAGHCPRTTLVPQPPRLPSFQSTNWCDVPFSTTLSHGCVGIDSDIWLYNGGQSRATRSFPNPCLVIPVQQPPYLHAGAREPGRAFDAAKRPRIGYSMALVARRCTPSSMSNHLAMCCPSLEPLR